MSARWTDLISIVSLAVVACDGATSTKPTQPPVVVATPVATAPPAPPAPPAPVTLPERGPGKCDAFVFDVFSGSVNDARAADTIPEIARKLPCWTSYDDEASKKPTRLNFRGGIYYGPQDLYFYTAADLIVARAGFGGTIKPALLGMSRKEATAAIGSVALVGTHNGSRIQTVLLLFDHAPVCIGVDVTAKDKVEDVFVRPGPCADVVKLEQFAAITFAPP